MSRRLVDSAFTCVTVMARVEIGSNRDIQTVNCTMIYHDDHNVLLNYIDDSHTYTVNMSSIFSQNSQA